MLASLRRTASLNGVSTQIIVLAALASYFSQVAASLLKWPLWGVVLATILPWTAVLAIEFVWRCKRYHLLAVFYLLAVTQTGHLLEHVAQVFQIHVLGLTGPDARGVFGALDAEWVHFIGNSWVIVMVMLLLLRFYRNPWIWLALVVAGWHEIEHASIMAVYLRTGIAGTPGLLSSGGLFFGGLPISRPDLHFLYNLVETLPLVAGFVDQVRRSYDTRLEKAFPGIADQTLYALSANARTVRKKKGEIVVRQGDRADSIFVVSKGMLAVSRQVTPGNEIAMATIKSGTCFGEVSALQGTSRSATVKALTTVELLVLDRAALDRVLKEAPDLAGQLGMSGGVETRKAAEIPKSRPSPLSLTGAPIRVAV